jgi:hypothetical protein
MFSTASRSGVMLWAIVAADDDAATIIEHVHGQCNMYMCTWDSSIRQATMQNTNTDTCIETHHEPHLLQQRAQVPLQDPEVALAGHVPAVNLFAGQRVDLVRRQFAVLLRPADYMHAELSACTPASDANQVTAAPWLLPLLGLLLHAFHGSMHAHQFFVQVCAWKHEVQHRTPKFQ